MRKLNKETKQLTLKARLRSQTRLENARSTLMTHQEEREKNINDLNKRHRKIDIQVNQAHQRLQEKIMLKREIDAIKYANLNQYRTHLHRQRSNQKMFVMLKERMKEEQIKRISTTQSKLQRTRNELNAKSITYRDVINTKICDAIVHQGYDQINSELINTLVNENMSKFVFAHFNL